MDILDDIDYHHFSHIQTVYLITRANKLKHQAINAISDIGPPPGQTVQAFTVGNDKKLVATPEERKYIFENYVEAPQVDKILNQFSSQVGRNAQTSYSADIFRQNIFSAPSGFSNMTADELHQFQTKLQNCNQPDIAARIKCAGFH